jgi:hypothetical protein
MAKMLCCPVCGTVKRAPRRQTHCSHKCHRLAHRAELSAWGRMGGKVSGARAHLRRNARSRDYREGYEAGWQAGRRNGWAEACGETMRRGRMYATSTNPRQQEAECAVRPVVGLGTPRLAAPRRESAGSRLVMRSADEGSR